MTLKADTINTAYSHLTIFGVSLGPSNEDTSFALNILESMMHELFSRNICVGYNFQDEPDVNDELGVERFAENGVATNLAIRLIAAFGKAVPPTLASQASQSLSNMSARTAQVRQTKYSNRVPRGAGNTLRFNRWNRYYRDTPDAPISCETNKMQVDEVNDFVEHYDSYLKSGEDIDTFTIEADTGMSIESSSNETPDINYRIKALSVNELGSTFQIVKIVITTTDGRVDRREIAFDITE